MSSRNSLSTCDSEEIDEDFKDFMKDFHALSVDQLNESEEKCKNLIVECDESGCKRKFLVRKLIELRYRRIQLIDGSGGKDEKVMDVTICGHHFKLLKQVPSKRNFCDFCSNVIWLFQQSYVCVDCCYAAHLKCVNHVERLCSHIIVCEKGIPELRICPEIGLSLQNYRCAECNNVFLNKQVYIEPRKCHYSGLYYCKSCHWNNSSIIPSNIIHNFDFEQKPVSRQALQEINLFYERPVIKLEELNPKLFAFNHQLGATKARRMQLHEMKRYMDVCKFAVNEKLINNVMNGRRYLIEGTEYYSIYDLVCVENCSMEEYLKSVISTFKNHVNKCEVSWKFFCISLLKLSTI